MKIIIATPIYPPEIGGPAVYAQKLKEGLEKRGEVVKIISYQGFKKYPQPFKIFLYFLKLFRKSKNGDLIYALNLVSCGLPAYFCRKKLVIRIGGDYLWERAVERGETEKPLREYYQKSRGGFKKKLIEKILRRANKLVFTSQFQRDIYLKYFNIKREKTIIIQNPFPEVKISNQWLENNYQLLYAGRLVKLKNLDFLLNVFHKILLKTKKDLILKIIGQGPEEEKLKAKSEKLEIKDRVIFEKRLSPQEIFKEIQKSYLCVLPSLTEITPNFALECIKLRKPILLTKETDFFEVFKNNLIFIDPRREMDLEEKILHLLDKRNYLNYIESLKKIPIKWSWNQVIEKHISIFKEIKKS